MMQVFVIAGSDEMALARTLAALVSGVVLGHVGRTAVFLQGGDDALGHLVEEAGCDRATGETAAAALAALRRARPGWWLVIEAGQVPREDWSEAMMHHAAAARLPGVMLAAAGGARIGGRIGVMLRRLSSRAHVLLLPPATAVADRAGAVAVRAGGAILRGGYER